MSGPSRTSQAVALVRAGLDRPVSRWGDADAQVRLCAGMRAAPIPQLVPHLRARTRFIDEELVAALDRGVGQIVTLGAGYDDRALRFRTPRARFFELDHPDTQSDKQARLRGLGLDTGGLTLVAADFRHDDVDRSLEAAGHEAEQPTVFICEGLLVYLDAATIVALLTALRARASPASRLLASLAIHAAGLSSNAVRTARNAGRRAADAEPWRTILPAAEHLRLLRDAGWAPAAEVDDQVVEPAAWAGRSLLVAADPVY